jgi:hypothetical protein
MRNFRCVCGNTLYFENSKCLGCGRAVGFLPTRLTLSALEPEGSDRFRALADGGSYRACRNGRDQQICNWMIDAVEGNDYCRACRLNHLIPDLSDATNRILWARIERAKRRLLYSLYALRLPVVGRDVDPVNGLAFEFLADAPVENEFADEAGAHQVLTGHRGGLITINIAEADPSTRESMRERMGEQYRTLLGHFRHEIAHYYWDRLIRSGGWHEPFRALFGDERLDYAAALRNYYANGPRPDWQEFGVSAYASSHPWEDWAETWAHYLHMVDTLETANDYGFSFAGRPLRVPTTATASEKQFTSGGIPNVAGIDEVLADWLQLTLALNALNRSMGQRDAYPFTLTARAVEKLRFVHQVIETTTR